MAIPGLSLGRNISKKRVRTRLSGSEACFPFLRQGVEECLCYWAN